MERLSVSPLGGVSDVERYKEMLRKDKEHPLADIMRDIHDALSKIGDKDDKDIVLALHDVTALLGKLVVAIQAGQASIAAVIGKGMEKKEIPSGYRVTIDRDADGNMLGAEIKAITKERS